MKRRTIVFNKNSIKSNKRLFCLRMKPMNYKFFLLDRVKYFDICKKKPYMNILCVPYETFENFISAVTRHSYFDCAHAF